MPRWLKAISLANPLTYQVDALRALMLVGGISKYGLATDSAVLAVITAFLLMIDACIYPRLTR